MIESVSEAEVLKAIKDLNCEGSPGPDGIQVFFYKELWDIVGSEVMGVIREFQSGNFGFERINRSYLFLLPKTPGAESFQEFRPIALSNSLYLVIGKVLANRLRPVLQDLIHLAQSAFLPSRSLQESFILAQEMVCG